MRPHLRAGAAIFNAGRYHAAHDAWEDHWLDLASGTPDERLLHGLIQYTAAVHHAAEGNWSGATGLAERARGYLEGLDESYRGVNVGAIRDYLDTLAADPEVVERGPPRSITHEGTPVGPTDLALEPTTVAAAVIAEADGFDEAVIEQASAFAQADVADDLAESPFVTLLFDFVREPSDRGIVFQRLAGHVQRRAMRESDVDGLFEG
jgi:hypothetical protein